MAKLSDERLALFEDFEALSALSLEEVFTHRVHAERAEQTIGQVFDQRELTVQVNFGVGEVEQQTENTWDAEAFIGVDYLSKGEQIGEAFVFLVARFQYPMESKTDFEERQKPIVHAITNHFVWPYARERLLRVADLANLPTADLPISLNSKSWEKYRPIIESGPAGD